MTETAFGNYVLGLSGLNLLRQWYAPPAETNRQRLLELTTDYAENSLLNFSFNTPELDAQTGYTAWAETYDGANPMIAAEEAVVLPRLAELFAPGMMALDAGCGTGRHARTLVDLGYQVTGTDLTPAMLDIARRKVPEADFRQGVFADLPIDDASVDLVTSALAVCHAQDLHVVFREFARVLRPGGRVLLSDPHPASGQFGGQAFFKGEGFDMPFVRNRAHPISEYVTAMIAAGFRVDAMIELPYDDLVIEALPSYSMFPEVTAGALKGLPFVLIWEATLSV